MERAERDEVAKPVCVYRVGVGDGCFLEESLFGGDEEEEGGGGVHSSRMSCVRTAGVRTLLSSKWCFSFRRGVDSSAGR